MRSSRVMDGPLSYRALPISPVDEDDYHHHAGPSEPLVGPRSPPTAAEPFSQLHAASRPRPRPSSVASYSSSSATAADADVENRKSVAFAKAAFTFRDRLDRVRAGGRDAASDRNGKRASTQSNDSQATLTVPGGGVLAPSSTTAGASGATEKTAVAAPPAKPSPVTRRIRLLRIVQNTLTAVLSLAIGFFQARVYLNFQSTKDVEGAWPVSPFVAPVLLLLSVAVAALVFDGCLLFAYFQRNRRAGRKALKIAVKAHWVVTTAKAISYGLSALICKTSMDYSKASGTNDDLWAFVCTEKAKEMDSVNHAKQNCTDSRVAWVFAVLNVGIEILGFIISQLVTWQQNKSKAATVDIEDADEKTQDDTVDALGDDIMADLGGLTPKINQGK